MASDMRKERKRNLLPAWVGIYGILMFLAHTVAWQAAHSVSSLRDWEYRVPQ